MPKLGVVQFTLSSHEDGSWGICTRLIDPTGQELGHEHDTLACGESIALDVSPGVRVECALHANPMAVDPRIHQVYEQ